jgi:hypothetical protein
MGEAWLSINAFAQADTVFTAILRHAAKAPLAERATILRDIVMIYASDTHAVRRATATAYMRQLDALGTPASMFRMEAHNALFDLGQRTDSVPLMAEHAALAVRIGNAMPKEMRKEAILPFVLAIARQADLDGRRGNFTAAMDSLAKAHRELSPIDPVVNQVIGVQVGKSMWYGKVLEPIKTNFVYLPGESTAVPSATLPHEGRVSLIMNINQHFFGTEQLGQYAMILELLQRFGDKLDVTLLAEASGSYQRRVIPDAEEAPVIRDFYRTYLKLPVTIAILSRTLVETRRDGMLIYAPNPNPTGIVTLIDKHRQVRNIDAGGPIRLLHMIEELLQEP